ncbi:unnamed protein product [Caenorhabditis auriculariae]|uniref:G-protein coupled receptors family 1 profile domain-containing protein n=1 Tax=Caenorhabditis auriculariae TaxID=2777116 RepID=A0A8S1GMW5_9PELO|nr:unnamed protein product [Caenorhabditis auriculariae]
MMNEEEEMTAEQMRVWLQSQLQQTGEPGDFQEINGSAGRWELVARRFGVAYVTLGVCAVIFNTFILACLLARRRILFSHVFYVIVLNFTLIDVIKGISSILFALKLLTSNMSIEASMWTVRVDQYSGVLLRFTNLATILNVLLITMNEFIFICYPLRYTILVTRKRVMLAIVGCWVLSAALTLVNMLASSQHRSVMIDTDCIFRSDNSTSLCVQHQPTSSSHHVVFHLALLAFCILCLAATASCYVFLFRLVSSMVKADVKNQAEFELLKEDSSSHRKQVVRRYKYVVIIGSVIVVYSAYLSAYAIIQGLQLVNISRNEISRKGFVYTKYVCYLFVAFHSLLQPLCFLRMREFRNVIHRTMCSAFRRESVLSTDFTCKRPSSQPTDI